MPLLGLLTALLSLSGCLNLQALSAGAVGCPPTEVEILNEDIWMPSIRTWQAVCQGRAHQCSFFSGRLHCSPLINLNNAVQAASKRTQNDG